MHHSALQTFRQMDISTRNISTWGLFGMRSFRHEEFSAQENFGTGTFRHMDIFAQVPKCLCQNVHIALQGAKISMCRNVQVPKCSGAEISLCRNVQVPKILHAENSPCRKYPMSKRSGVEKSICRNVRSAERFMCRNVPVMKHPCQNDSCRNVPSRNGL